MCRRRAFCLQPQEQTVLVGQSGYRIRLAGTVLPDVASIREVTRHEVILEVKTPDHALENTFAAARYEGMLTPSNNLYKIGAILVLRREPVSCPECAGPSTLLTVV